MNESLNIEYNKRQLMLKALKKFGRVVPAAKALGISKTTLHAYKRKFNIFEAETPKR